MAYEYLGTLGLCLRAGKLTAGMESVLGSIPDSKTRLIVLASDAGESTVKSVTRAAETRSLPIITVKADSGLIGNALGKQSCAVCSISEIGFANAGAKKAAEENPYLSDIARQLSEKNEKISSRRGRKKTGNKAKTDSGSKRAGQINSKKHGGERT